MTAEEKRAFILEMRDMRPQNSHLSEILYGVLMELASQTWDTNPEKAKKILCAYTELDQIDLKSGGSMAAAKRLCGLKNETRSFLSQLFKPSLEFNQSVEPYSANTFVFRKACEALGCVLSPRDQPKE